MRPTGSARLRVLAVVTALLALFGPGEPAAAGTFEVVSCSEHTMGGPLRGADDAWAFASNDAHEPPHIERFRRCPVDLNVERDGAYNAHADGLAVWTGIDVPGDPDLGTRGAWTFMAAPGTAITRIRVAGEAGKQLDDWELYTRLADGTKLPGSDCRVHQDAYECTIGGPGAPYQDWDLPTLGHAPTTRVSVGIACSWATTSCGMGMTLHEAWVSIYSSRITLVDDSRPAVGGVTGPLVADGWKRGTVPVTIAGATDNAGILALRVTAAGEDLAVRDLACDFTRTRPCADVGTTTLQADTRRLPDGTYPLQVSAVDAARNVTAVRQPIRIDNTPPAPPLPVGALAQRTTLPEATVAWAAPDGQAAPVTTAHWSICGPTGCSTGTRESGAGGTLAVPTDAAGTYVVRVSLEDAAGNHDAARTTTWNVTREVEGPSVATPVTTPAPRPPDRPAAPASPAAPAAPRLRLTGAPTVAPDGRTIAVRGSAAAAATGSVEVVVRARIAGRLRRVTRRAAIRERRFAVRLRLPSRAWSTAKVQVRYAGNGRVGASTLTSRVRRPAR